MHTLVKPTFFAIAGSIFLMIISAVAMAVMPDNQAVSRSAVPVDSTKKTIKYRPDELLVKFKAITSVSKSNAVNKLKTVDHLSGIGISSTAIDIVFAKPFETIKNSRKLGVQSKGVQSSNQSGLDNWWHIKLGKEVDLQRALETLSARPDVELVEYNYEVRALLTPNDPRFDSLWGATDGWIV